MEGNSGPQFGRREQHCDRKRRHDDKAHNDRRGPRSQQHRRKQRINDSKTRNFSANAAICDKQKKVNCSVCSVDDPKYKCPKCRSTYCGIDCCRKHKEEFCPLGNTSESKEWKQSDDVVENLMQTFPPSRYLSKLELAQIQDKNKFDLNELQKKLRGDALADDDLGPGWKMTGDMVEMMRKSSWLRDEVADFGLQQLIVKIASSSGNIVNANRRGYSSSSPQFSTNVITYREQLLSDIKSQYPQFQIFVDKLLYLTGIYERSDRTENDSNGTIDESLSKVKHATFSLKPLPQRVRPGSTSLTKPCQYGGTDCEPMSSDSDDDDASETDDKSENYDDGDQSANL